MSDYKPTPEVLIALLRKNKAGKIAALGVSVVPDLVNALKHADWRVRATAAKALGHMATAHPEYDWAVVSPSLIDGLSDDGHAWVRARAAGALCSILDGGTKLGLASSRLRIRTITELLNDAESREDAMKLFARIGAPAATELLKILRDTDLWTIENIRKALVWIGMPAVPELLEFISSKLPSRQDNARENAFQALCEITEKQPEQDWQGALLVLTRYVKQKAQCKNAASALGAIAAKHPEYDWKSAAEKMAAEIKTHEDAGAIEPHKALLDALVKIGVPAIPALLKAMKKTTSEDSERRLAGTLENIGVEKITSVDERVHCMLVLGRDEDIARIGAPAIPALVQGLESPRPTTHVTAIQALGRMGPVATPAVLLVLEHENMYVRRNAVVALGRIGDASAVPALGKHLDDKDWGVRKNAIEALGKMGAPAVPVLLGALKKTETRRDAITTLESLAEKVDVCLEEVRTALLGPVEEARKKDPRSAKAAESEALRSYMRICEAAKKHAAAKHAELGDGVILVGETPKPPENKMFRRGARRAFA